MSYSNPLFWWCFALTAWIVFGIAWSWLLARAAGREEPKPWPRRWHVDTAGEHGEMPTGTVEIAPFRRVRREEKRHE